MTAEPCHKENTELLQRYSLVHMGQDSQSIERRECSQGPDVERSQRSMTNEVV